MNFSVNTVLFVSPFRDADARLFRKINAWGFDKVELLVENLDDITASRLSRALQQSHLACGSICAGMNRHHDMRGSQSSQRNAVKFLCGLLDLMDELRCPILAGPIYSYVGRTGPATTAERRQQWRSVVKNLKAVCHHAEELGRTVCLEPINRFETDFINTMGQGLQMIDDVGSPALKLHLDTFHANIEEKSIPQAIRQAGAQLAHIHACGCDRGTPGRDHIDWVAIKHALNDINYQGDVVIESVTLDVPNIAKSAAIWRRIEPTRDEIAIDGLKLLKTALLD